MALVIGLACPSCRGTGLTRKRVNNGVCTRTTVMTATGVQQLAPLAAAPLPRIPDIWDDPTWLEQARAIAARKAAFTL